jgi:hypothetical protein
MKDAFFDSSVRLVSVLKQYPDLFPSTDEKIRELAILGIEIMITRAISRTPCMMIAPLANEMNHSNRRSII